ncbi:hypothetical protein BS47DRAFT_1360500 [Hydnum rufescens UP504]|uniref:Uncharacterized protein n=1 Tax=Hydnum rufescens UP504 TaxID=1448309 RepID=A0A9P6B291_9AGAM|nr:hypothetical protein BS47DRAFT_1360500 [Hydnum rufescens UP504]
MTEDTYYGANAKSSLVFKSNTRHDAPPYQGIWVNKESETVADIIVFGIIKSADVGPYGNQSTAPPNSWNISKIRSAKRCVVIHMPRDAGATLQKTFKEICRSLYELEDDVIDKGAPNSYDDDAESAKEEEVKIIYSCPYCDPKGYFENLKDSEKKGFIYHVDCGAYDSEGTTVNIDDLESAFLPGMAVIASINPHFVGLAFKNDFPSSAQLDDTSPSKCRTTPKEFNIGPSPKKKLFIVHSPADKEPPKKTVPAAVLPVSPTPKCSSSKKGKS